MADEAKEKGPMDMLIAIALILGGAIVVWFMAGGPAKTDLRGIFLNPAPPVDSGDAYGPTPPLPHSNQQQ